MEKCQKKFPFQNVGKNMTIVSIIHLEGKSTKNCLVEDLQAPRSVQKIAEESRSTVK